MITAQSIVWLLLLCMLPAVAVSRHQAKQQQEPLQPRATRHATFTSTKVVWRKQASKQAVRCHQWCQCLCYHCAVAAVASPSLPVCLLRVSAVRASTIALRALLCTRKAVSSEWYYCHAGSNLKRRRRRRRRTTLWLRPSSSSYERRKEFGGGLYIQQPLCFFLLLTGVGEGPEVEDVMMIMMIWIISSSLTQCNGTNDIKCPSQRHRCCHSFTNWLFCLGLAE